VSLLVVALVPGLLAGWAVGGRLSRLAELDLRAPAVIFAAVALQLGLGRAPTSARLPLLVVSAGLIGAWLVLNARRRAPLLGFAIGVLALGWLLNVAVMVPNRGMPVSDAALARIGAPAETDVSDGSLFKHIRADRDSSLRWLGDTIPVRPLGAVVSAGDIVMALGVTLVLGAGMAGRDAAATVPAST